MENTYDIFEAKPEETEVAQPIEMRQKDERVEFSERTLTAYRSTSSNWMKEVARDRGFVNGVQWKLTDVQNLLARNQMPIVVNVIKQAVEQAKAMLTTNKPRFTATAREDSDNKRAAGWAAMMAYDWDRSSGNTVLKTAIDHYYVDSVGWLFQYFDPYADNESGRVIFDTLDPREVFVDPTSTDVFARDAQHILIAKTMTYEQISSLYPQKREELKYMTPSTHNAFRVVSDRTGLESQADNQRTLDNFHDHFDVIDRYSRVKLQRHHIYDTVSYSEYILTNEKIQEFLQKPAFIQKTQDGKEHPLTTERLVEEAQGVIEQYGPVYHMVRDVATGQVMLASGPMPEVTEMDLIAAEQGQGALPVDGSQTELQQVTMGDLIKTGVLNYRAISKDRVQRVLSAGGVLLADEIIEVSRIPIFPIYANFDGTPFNYSPVRGVRGLQEYVNKMYSLIVAHAANAANVKVMIPRGSQNVAALEAKMAKSGTAVIEFDPELGQPVIVGPVAFPNELYTNVENAKKEIQEQLGIFALMQGSPDQAPDTYKGTVALDEYGQRRIKAMKDDIEASINEFARVYVEMVQAYYKQPKIMRIVRPNQKEQVVVINGSQGVNYTDITDVAYHIEDVSVGMYDIIVVSGSMLPSNRWAISEYYQGMYEKGLIDQEETLKKSETVDVEGVLERFSQMKQMQQMIEQLQGQVKQLSGDLQTAQRETVHAKQQLEVNNMSVELEKQKARVESAVELFGQRLKDEHALSKNLRREKRKSSK